MKALFSLTVLLIGLSASAQKEEKDRILPTANEQFAEKNYTEAEANYRISQSRFPKKAVASYNLGNAIYRINQPSEAKNAYAKAVENAKTRSEKHRAYHNLGNVYMKEKNYTEAVAAYKNALINDPSDEETRYNYALAKKFLKDNPPPKNKKDDKKDKNQDKKDQKDKDKNKDNDKGKDDDKKDKGDNKPDNKQNQDQKQEQPKPKPQQGNGISKQRVENLLDAVNNEERKVQNKVNGKKVKGKPVQTEKDW